MSLVTLRLRGPNGVSTIQLAPEASLFELQASIFSITSIAPEVQQIRAGHPPRLLDTTSDQDATLKSLGLSNGDVLTVQQGKPGDAATSSSIGKTVVSPPPTAKTLSSVPPPSSSSSASAKRTSAPSASSSSVPAAKPSVPIRTASELPEGTTTTAAANTRSPSQAPVIKSPTLRDGSGQQPGRNARPQQPFALPLGSSAPSGAKPGLLSTEDAHVKVDGGWLVLRVVPDDNSCMFTALAIVLEHDKKGAMQALREDVASVIRNDPFTWSEAVLGMKPAVYCDKIVKKETWGGAIELAIMSDKYKTEIVSIDVQTGRADRFGEEHNYENHVILIYSGIHYDAVTFTPLEPTGGEVYPYSLEFDQTIFSKNNEGYALAAATELARKLRDRHYYTDTAGFALKCEICKTALKGEKEAQAHAKQTGHANFGEF